MSLSAPEIFAQVQRVLASDSTASTVAIRAAASQPWPETLTLQGRAFRIRWCSSSLAIREALCDAEQENPATTGLVVVTPLATHEVAEDVAARLARARVYQPAGWDMVRQLFQAKDTDSRLGRFAWMPQTLIEGAAQGPYPPVPSGFLDLETAWAEVLWRFLTLETARPDAVALLEWSLDPRADGSMARLPAQAQVDALAWLGDAAGVAGELVLACVSAGRGADALPLGLVCGLVFAQEAEGQVSLGQAAIRLERYVDGKHVGVAAGRAWARAAVQVVQKMGDASLRMLERADALMRELNVVEFAHLSETSPAGLDQQLRAFATALAAQVADPSKDHLIQVEQQADRALRHHLASAQGPRLKRVAMARRLARWLMQAPPRAPSLSLAVEWQADQGAFVDWARFSLLGGDAQVPELSDAYRRCREAVIARRNEFAKAFAQALIQWNANKPGPEGRTVPLESVLDHVLGPIAQAHPVLLLVMDGLSISIFRDLFADMGRNGWAELVPSHLGRALSGVAAIPTITEVSRASLLCGRLTLGAASLERSGFVNHPALVAQSRADAPPRLFHKGDLADSTNLSPEVIAAVSNPQQKVVGVVYNAVDDHLSGPDQLNQRWSLEDLRLLLPLLNEARMARRVLVITADHGHLLEDGTTQLIGGESDRWRLGKSAVTDHEFPVSGGRVLTSDGANAVVCLWGESTRYAGRKNGYHGGLSPQEVAVPLSVLVPSGLSLDGWALAPAAQPDWWELPPLPEHAGAPVAVAPRPTRPRPAAAAQPQLFEMAAPSLPAAPQSAPSQDWIDAMLSSPIYASQRQLAARVALPDEKMRVLLLALAERGGKLSLAALAHRLGLPEVRLGGLLSAVRRLLNVDQALVLRVDEAAGMVELNKALLLQQFQLRGQGEAP